MDKILTEQEIMHYAEHASHKWIDQSSEREIVEVLAESHLSLLRKIEKLEERHHERFDALQELAFALWKENPSVYESICKNNTYLNAFTEHTGSVY